MSLAPPQCPLHCPQHPALPFGRICNPIPPQRVTLPLHSSHFLPLVTPLKSIVPMKFGSKEAESPPMGARLPSAPSQGTGPHYREQGPSSCLSRSLPILKAGGVGTDLRDGSSSRKVPKDPVATSQRFQDHMTQEVIRISLLSKWKTQKQGKNRHFGRGQGKAGIRT